MKSKKEIAQFRFHHWQPHVLCPICHQPLIENNFHLSCVSHHNFDIAKQGYINLAPQHQEAYYSKNLFQARHQVMGEIDFYHGLHERLVNWLFAFSVADTQQQRVLDLGTGEGTHLAKFAQSWATKFSNELQAIGLDLAKDGITEAAKHYTDALWLVADLSKLPFADQSVDGALTILSPSNYEELKRVLKPGAWFVKVIPGQNYLRELREIVLPAEEIPHQNTDSIIKFEQAFSAVAKHQFLHTAAINPEAAELIANMTPLFWHATPDQHQLAHGLNKITVDLVILIGRV